MRYADVVMDHFHAPRCVGRMRDPDLVGTSGTPGRGNFMVLYVRLEGDRVAEASYQTYGCCPAIAAGSLLTESLAGSTRAELAEWDEPRLNQALGGLPRAKRHCSALAIDALERVLEAWPSGLGPP